MVGYDHDAVLVPHSGVLAKFAFEHADCAWAAYIVCHKDVSGDPDVVARMNT